MNTRLVTVEVETSLGDKYIFPSMSLEVLEHGLPKVSRDGLPETILFFNVSLATLTLPTRIIKTVRVDGDVWLDFSA